MSKTRVNRGLWLLSVLFLLNAVFTPFVFASPKDSSGSVSTNAMPVEAPPMQKGSISQGSAAPFSLNASKTQENTIIPRPSFNLNASRFSQGAEQSDTQLSSGAPKFDVSAFQRSKLSGNVQTQAPLTGGVQAIKLLANYNIELIVDESMSMRKMDCPGGLSRWNWCGMQAGQLARQIAPFVGNGFTLTTFAGGYNVYNNSTPENVMHLFQNPMFSFGTRMSQPLADRLNNYFEKGQSNKKPLLIAVITDGVPAPRYEPQLVVDVLVEATRKLRNQQELKVLFLQVGSQDPRGQFFLNNLDHRLTEVGARYDIVQTVTFDYLEQVGLGQALASCVSRITSKTVRQSTIPRTFQ